MFISTKCQFKCGNCDEQLERLKELAGINERALDYDLDKKYDHFNQILFNNELPKIPIKWNKSKRVSGVVKARANVIQGRKVLVPDSMVMEISDLFKRSEQDLDAILIHEMIHVYYFHNNILDEVHGPRFIAFARKLSDKIGFTIPLTDTVTDLEMTDNEKTKQVAVLVNYKNDGTKSIAIYTPKFAKENLETFKKIWKGMVNDKRSQSAQMILVDNPTWTKVSANYPVVRTFDKLFKVSDQTIFDDLNGEILFDF